VSLVLTDAVPSALALAHTDLALSQPRIVPAVSKPVRLIVW